MGNIRCPRCGTETGEESIYCPRCGWRLQGGSETGAGAMNGAGGMIPNSGVQKAKHNNKMLIIGLLAAIIVAAFVILFLVLPRFLNSKEYCEGLRWGTSISSVEKKYPDLTDSEEGYYFDLVDSLDGYEPEDDMIDVNFYFDSDDKLNKIEASIVSDDIGEAILYYVDHFNEVYDADYEAAYDTRYKWYGKKTNVSMTATGVLLTITYEDAEQ